MKPKKEYKINDRVLVESFAGPEVCVILKKRYIANQSEHKIGVDGWYALIANENEVNKLRNNGVPYRKGEKPEVWIFDWQIIKKCRDR